MLPRFGDELRVGFCEACAPLLERARFGPAVYEFGGPLAEAIHRFKYERRMDLLEPLSALLAEASQSLAGRVDVVVPVPLHPAKKRARGFDQVTLLAKPTARALGVPLVHALRRDRDVAPQVGKSVAARAQNVRNAFRLRRPGQVDGARILLVDDVTTTGATLRAARHAFGAAASVRKLALAGAQV